MSNPADQLPESSMPTAYQKLLDAIEQAGRSVPSKVVESLCAADPSLNPDDLRAGLYHLAVRGKVAFDGDWMVSVVGYVSPDDQDDPEPSPTQLRMMNQNARMPLHLVYRTLLEAIQMAGRSVPSKVIESLCAADPSLDPEDLRMGLYHLAANGKVAFDADWMVSPLECDPPAPQPLAQRPVVG